MKHKAFAFVMGMLVMGVLVVTPWQAGVSLVPETAQQVRSASIRLIDGGPSHESIGVAVRPVTAVTGYTDQGRAEPAFNLEEVVPAVVQVLAESTGGSGVIIDPAGVVLTSAHLVGDYEHVTVRVGAEEYLDGTVSRVDKKRDLALVRLPPGTYHPAELGTEASIWLGAPVYAVGYPLNMAGPPTITRGIVSRYLEEPDSHRKVIQTDAVINLGNSGGPILDSSGRVIGIVTSILGDYPSVLTTGISFAVAVDTVRNEFMEP